MLLTWRRREDDRKKAGEGWGVTTRETVPFVRLVATAVVTGCWQLSRIPLAGESSSCHVRVTAVALIGIMSRMQSQRLQLTEHGWRRTRLFTAGMLCLWEDLFIDDSLLALLS